MSANWWDLLTKQEVSELNDLARHTVLQKLWWWNDPTKAKFWPSLRKNYPDNSMDFYESEMERGAFLYEAKARFECHDGNQYLWPQIPEIDGGKPLGGCPFGEIESFQVASSLAFCHVNIDVLRIYLGDPETKVIQMDDDDRWSQMVRFNLETPIGEAMREFEKFFKREKERANIGRKRSHALRWRGLEAFDRGKIYSHLKLSPTQKTEMQRAKSDMSMLKKYTENT